MAKQTFTTGQVLTAAQMTSLQQTAMGGGAAVTKTASYVLVAADAGTTIQMNSASPTTVTANTALFAAGDVVFIQNIGAGACTVTAGTATVTTAGSLVLTQWEGGQLYFTSTSASIFFDYIQAGTTLPLTTKGDLFGYDTANARIPVGTNNQVLTADSAQALGVKWATATSSKQNWTLLNTGGTALSGSSSVQITGISSADQVYVLLVASTNMTTGNINLTINNDTAANYVALGMMHATNATTPHTARTNSGAINSLTLASIGATANIVAGGVMIHGAGSTNSMKIVDINFCSNATATGYGGNTYSATYSGTAAITSIEVFPASTTFASGTVYVYTTA